jgi:hypothetical protein
MSYPGTPIVVTPTTFSQPGGTPPTWVKYTKVFGDFSDAGVFKEIALYTLPIAGVIHSIKTKHSVAFSGGGAALATIEVGLAGNTDKYAAAFDVFQAVAAATFQYTAAEMSENHTATTPITITLRSDVALNTLAAGSVTVYLLISTAV